MKKILCEGIGFENKESKSDNAYYESVYNWVLKNGTDVLGTK